MASTLNFNLKIWPWAILYFCFCTTHQDVQCGPNHIICRFFGSIRSSRNANLCLSICSVKFCQELTIIFLSQVSPRSVSGQSQVSLGPLLGLSELTLSVRQKLKYFILLSMFGCGYLFPYQVFTYPWQYHQDTTRKCIQEWNYGQRNLS